MKKISLLFAFLPFFVIPAKAQQSVKDWLQQQVDTLCSPAMYGRGYVEDGRLKAADYIVGQFRKFELLPPDNGSYTQTYSFPVNTFPDRMFLSVNGRELTPGVDFLIDAGSPSFTTKKLDVKHIDLADIKDKTAWNVLKISMMKDQKHAYYLEDAEALSRNLSLNPRHLAAELPAGCFILPQHGKLTWTVDTKTIAATVFYVEDTVLPKKIKHVKVDVDAKFIKAAKSENVIGMVRGQIADSFIVFTAHHDHLGMMGSDALFPGASDNASGTATLLYLAKYFAAHPLYYTVVFISFSGEEPGLLGSEYFVKHPLIPLDHIRLLTNIDIMGDAGPGVTVVNATEFPHDFALLKSINQAHNFLPEIKSRGKAANSDHYNFSEQGIPALFIYSNGGKGYYHDVFDRPSSLSFNNVDNLIRLLIAFSDKLE